MPKFTEWVLDSPLFIDKPQVTAFYDAIVRPEHTVEAIDISDETLRNNLQKITGTVEGTVGAEGGVGWLAKLKASITGKVEVSEDRGWSKRRGSTWKLSPVNNPYRQLLHLVTHYLANSPDRILVCSNIGGFPTDDKYIIDTPRALVFMDLVPPTSSSGLKKGVVLIPTAFESAQGKVTVLLDKLDQAIRESYPHPHDRDGLRNYWQAYTDAFDAQDTMKRLEDAVGKCGKIEWIDYRMPIWADADSEQIVTTGHLHLVAHGEYDTGTFGYNFVKRGYKHGLRIVGTLKSEPDINVLAVFER